MGNLFAIFLNIGISYQMKTYKIHATRSMRIQFFGLHVNGIGKESFNSWAVGHVKVGHGWVPSDIFCCRLSPHRTRLFDGLSVILISFFTFIWSDHGSMYFGSSFKFAIQMRDSTLHFDSTISWKHFSANTVDRVCYPKV